MFLHTGRGQGRGGDSGDRGNVKFTLLNNSDIDEIVAVTDGESKPIINCFGYLFNGHYYEKYP